MQTHRSIRRLSPEVAERIAAGEVIERPASVVKELLENSLDAGATEILIRLEDGGKQLIELTDNGSGMLPEDLSICAERHATSKLTSLDDLDRITSFGFRGEALASVSAVSDFSIVSRAQDRAYRLRVLNTRAEEVEEITFGHFIGSERGTQVRVERLFSQVPARLKFLKSKGAEVSAVRDWVERVSLSHPKCGFRLISDDRTVLDLRPETEAGRVARILADSQDIPVVSTVTDSRLGSIRARAYWLQGFSAPHPRLIFQLVNGRSVRDRMLQQAVLSSFRQSLLPGQFPAAVVYLEVDPAKLDVNVHPTKAEVRFLESGAVFTAVEESFSKLISQHGAPVRVGARYEPSLAPDPLPTPSSAASLSAGESLWSGVRSWQPPAPQTSSFFDEKEKTNPFLAGIYLGTVFRTYLLFDLGEELGLIDQHAAHERIRYEALKRTAFSKETLVGQPLLIPLPVQLKAGDLVQIQDRLHWLEELGFDAEVFGEDQLLFRSVPSGWGTTGDLPARLRSLTERLLHVAGSPSNGQKEELHLDESLFEELASEACHSAIRAGDSLLPQEASALVDSLFRCAHPWNCPHGRPTVARVPRARFEEWFQRRI